MTPHRSIPELLRGFARAMLVAAVAAGCAPGDDASPQSAPLFAAGPSHPGRSGILRIGDEIGFFVTDAERGFTAFHGLGAPLAEICAGAPPALDSFDLQLLFSPTGALHALFVQKAHNVWIYPASPPGCTAWSELPLLASGTARIVRTDNDLTAVGPGANAFGWQATGTLAGPGGERISYAETVRLVVEPHADPGDPAGVEEKVVDIRLHTPAK